ncbi:FMN-binding negative transcriptional regulator [Nocardiopsis composta]|uniref:Transcriptional regulator n=1 Tax=Nocardiopsis composta TaxID=157465 RepID=A0A7W8VC79_9ACTN|nr:FMN-binding negative transcriptional regulator [Nocardiopsis composta]MBB5430932.1 transcriptional regulator [Nocardiopsis composta]
MHVYGSYAAPSEAAKVDLVRRFPFAVVAASPPEGPPVAAHLPLILPQDAPPPERLEGAVLLGHMARRNPQWRMFAGGPRILAVFSSPHGYVSPSLYPPGPAAPTLDYAAVHVTGRVELTDTPEDSLHVVEETVRALESRRAPQWDMAGSRGFFASIVRHVVSFRVHVEEAPAMFKLSQDMPADVRDRVARDLSATVGPELSALVAEAGPGREPGAGV